MKKNVLTAGIMAAFVAAALSGCQAEDQAEIFSYANTDQCVANGGDYFLCQGEYEKAQAMHEEVAPKFESSYSCVQEFGSTCENRTIRNADGSQSNVWLPFMAGYMMGNMTGTNAALANRTPTQPLYMSGATRQGDRHVGTYSTAAGTAVSPGKSMVNSSLVANSPTRATVASTKSAVSSRGGFGASARGGSGAS